MEQPTIKSAIRDAERDITYIVLAYRTLSRSELVMAVRVFLQQNRKHPKKGSVVTIHSLIGFDGP